MRAVLLYRSSPLTRDRLDENRYNNHVVESTWLYASPPTTMSPMP